MEHDINDLIKDCVDYLKQESYSSDRIRTYCSLWRNGLLFYMKNNHLSVYSTDVGKHYIASLLNNTSHTTQTREKIRSVYVLDDFITLGYVRKRRTIPISHPLEGEIGEQMQKHIQHLYYLRRSPITINRNKVYLYRFLIFLRHNGVENIDNITDKHIWGFLTSSGTNNHHVVSTLRVMFNFWSEQKITKKNLADYLVFYKASKREKIPSYYSLEEINLIENTVDRTNQLGKRDYAILLLASRLGLRAADIANLRFANLDWENNQIIIEQQKTGNQLTLPLLIDVGNAIIDYLKHSRRKSTSQYIFLKDKPPYPPINSTTVSSAISQIIIKSKVSIDSRRHGSHSMRHSLASNLLVSETPIPTITAILGHTTSESTKYYLKVDIKSLTKCALPVPSISEGFYNQKNGLFYEKRISF